MEGDKALMTRRVVLGATDRKPGPSVDLMRCSTDDVSTVII
jgi:hypothetical protein